MNLRALSIASVATMLSLLLITAAVSAAERPAVSPKKPAIDKTLTAVPQKPFLHKKLMALPAKPAIKHKLLAAPKRPVPQPQGIEARLFRLERKLDAIMRELQELRRELRARPPMPKMMRPGPDAGPHLVPQFGPPAGPPAKSFHGGHPRFRLQPGPPADSGRKPTRPGPAKNAPDSTPPKAERGPRPQPK